MVKLNTIRGPGRARLFTLFHWRTRQRQTIDWYEHLVSHQTLSYAPSDIYNTQSHRAPHVCALLFTTNRALTLEHLLCVYILQYQQKYATGFTFVPSCAFLCLCVFGYMYNNLIYVECGSDARMWRGWFGVIVCVLNWIREL